MKKYTLLLSSIAVLAMMTGCGVSSVSDSSESTSEITADTSLNKVQADVPETDNSDDMPSAEESADTAAASENVPDLSGSIIVEQENENIIIEQTTETNDEMITDETEPADDGGKYLGEWSSYGNLLEIMPADYPGSYSVHVYCPNSSSSILEWNYVCFYDASAKALVSETGVRTDYKFISGSDEPVIEYSYEQAARFHLNAGGIQWIDDAGNMGAGMYFS